MPSSRQRAPTLVSGLPASKMMAPVGLGMRFSRLKSLRASALLTWAYARSSELSPILGLCLGLVEALRVFAPCALAVYVLLAACLAMSCLSLVVALSWPTNFTVSLSFQYLDKYQRRRWVIA